jgi:hypothetical protein
MSLFKIRLTQAEIDGLVWKKHLDRLHRDDVAAVSLAAEEWLRDEIARSRDGQTESSPGPRPRRIMSGPAVRLSFAVAGLYRPGASRPTPLANLPLSPPPIPEPDVLRILNLSQFCGNCAPPRQGLFVCGWPEVRR